MSDDALDALFGTDPAEKPEIEKPAEAVTPPADGPVRDDGGRFAAKTPEQPKVETPPPAVTPVVEQPQPKPEHGGLTGPALAAVLDEREKRRTIEREFADFKAKHQQKESIPSIQDDPEGFQRHLSEQAGRVELNARFGISERFAIKDHGKEAVEAAKEWGMQRAQTSPAFAADYARNEDPIDWVVRQHKKDRLLSELGDDDATQKAFIERRARELGLIPASITAPAAPAAQPQPTSPPPQMPRRSQASDVSAGGIQTPVLKTQDEVFKGTFS